MENKCNVCVCVNNVGEFTGKAKCRGTNYKYIIKYIGTDDLGSSFFGYTASRKYDSFGDSHYHMGEKGIVSKCPVCNKEFTYAE